MFSLAHYFQPFQPKGRQMDISCGLWFEGRGGGGGGVKGGNRGGGKGGGGGGRGGRGGGGD